MGVGRRAGPRARVLIVSARSLFVEGIEGLLRREPGLEIAGWETEPAEAVGRIKDTAPDVVITTAGEAATGFGAQLLRLVREGLPMRIVEIDLATNSLCIYCGERRSIREVGGLVDAVERICDCLSREPHGPVPPVMEPPAT